MNSYIWDWGGMPSIVSLRNAISMNSHCGIGLSEAYGSFRALTEWDCDAWSAVVIGSESAEFRVKDIAEEANEALFDIQ